MCVEMEGRGKPSSDESVDMSYMHVARPAERYHIFVRTLANNACRICFSLRRGIPPYLPRSHKSETGCEKSTKSMGKCSGSEPAISQMKYSKFGKETEEYLALGLDVISRLAWLGKCECKLC